MFGYRLVKDVKPENNAEILDKDGNPVVPEEKPKKKVGKKILTAVAGAAAVAGAVVLALGKVGSSGAGAEEFEEASEDGDTAPFDDGTEN